MPCRGRTEQTIANVKRLLAMAGRVEWQLICVTDNDRETNAALADFPIWRANRVDQGGYWQCMKDATDLWPGEFDHIVNLANDLLPGRDWLERCYSAYRARFGAGDGLMGFNDGLHGPELSPHFLISNNDSLYSLGRIQYCRHIRKEFRRRPYCHGSSVLRRTHYSKIHCEPAVLALRNIYYRGKIRF